MQKMEVDDKDENNSRTDSPNAPVTSNLFKIPAKVGDKRGLTRVCKLL